MKKIVILLLRSHQNSLKMKYQWLLTLCLFLTLAQLPAQDLGKNPTGLNWQIMESPTGNVIFPKSMEQQANRVVNIINYQRATRSQSIGEQSKKVNIIFQNQTVLPGGSVSLTPFRSDFLSTPFESMTLLGSLDWVDALSVHEYRHVQQLSNTHNGLTKCAHVLQGEGAWGLLTILNLPLWFIEGDAVVAETAYTNGGRGKSPAFTAQQRALAMADKNFNYLQAVNLSFKHLIPHRYPFGYMMVSHIRNEKGNNIMAHVLKDASTWKRPLYPFSSALKKHTGYSTKTLYKAAWENAKKDWRDQLADINLLPTTPITTPHPTTVTNYFFPQFDTAGNILALKSSFKETEHFVRISKEGEQKIVSKGFDSGAYLNTNQQELVWTEVSQDPRRTNRTYSDIYLYDLQQNKKQQLSKKGKYFSPIINADGTKVIAIEIAPDQTCALKEIAVNTGASTIITIFPVEEFIARPAYAENDQAVVYLLKKNNQLAIWKYNLVTHIKTQLTPWTAHTLDAPRVQGGQVYYQATFNGIDNIYRSPLDGSQTIEQLTSVPIGAYEPSVSKDGQTLLFTEHTLMGKVISKMTISEKPNKSMLLPEIIEPNAMQWQNKVVDETEVSNILDDIPQKEYTIKAYKGAFKDIKLHSWDLDPSLSEPSITLRFDDYLGNVNARLQGGYNRNENGAFFGGRFSYGKWYPVIDVLANQRYREADFLSTDTLTTQSFNETSAGVNIKLPHQWAKGNFTTSLAASVGINHHSITKRRMEETTELANTNYNSVKGTLSFSSIRRRAFQNLTPRFGIKSTLSYTRNLKELDNEKINGSATFFLPGLSANHSLRLSGGYQKELLTNSFQFTDNFEYVRGYQIPTNDKITRFTVDYSFPLVYPDFGVAGITYFKRISANVFYDYGQSTFEKLNQTTHYQSVGLELLFANQWMNVFEFSLGIRGTYLINEDINNIGQRFVPSFGFFSEF